MALYWLMNSVRVYSRVRYAGEKVNDASEDISKLKALGGLLYPVGNNATVDAAGANAQSLRARGADETDLNAIMAASFDGYVDDQVGSLIYGAAHGANAAHLDGVNTFTFANLVGSVYTLTKDVFFTDGTLIDAGITLKTAGFRVFCNGMLTNNGTISNDGNNGALGVAGAASAVGSLGIGTAGGAGGTNGVGTGATNQANGLADGTGAGGLGGAGGANAGGAAGTYTAAAVGFGESHLISGMQLGFGVGWSDGTTVTSFVMGGGAGGGGGGSNNGGVVGGGGGGGGGVMVLAVMNLVNNGTIRCKGGDGAAASGAGGNGGGGGGGGGGLIQSISRFRSGSGTMACPGGAGGAPVAAGVAGAAGAAGHVNAFSA